MPKRSFESRVLDIIRGTQETKRVVQTKRANELNYYGLAQTDVSGNVIESVHTLLTPVAHTYPDGSLDGPTSGTDSTGPRDENTYCWELQSNLPKFWPVDFFPIKKGLNSGHDSSNAGAFFSIDTNAPNRDTRNPDNSFACRIGTEIWCKGVSLEMMWSKELTVPRCDMNILLIKYAKGDHPTPYNIYKNYTGVKELDMFDNRRFKIVKKWHRTLYDNNAIVAASNDIVRGKEGFIGTDISYQKTVTEPVVPTANADTHMVIKSLVNDTALSLVEWKSIIPEGYRILNELDMPSASTGNDVWWTNLASKHNFMQPTLLDSSHGFYYYYDIQAQSNPDADTIRTYIYNTAFPGGVQRRDWNATPTTFKQCLIIKTQTDPQHFADVYSANPDPKEGEPKQDAMMVAMDRKIKLWIPGYLFGKGGYKTFKEPQITGTQEDSSFALDERYEYCLMFQTYQSYKTPTGYYDKSVNQAAGPNHMAPIMARMSDFLQITYFKDP